MAISEKEIKILEAVLTQVRKVVDADHFYAVLYDRVRVQLEFPVLAEKSDGNLEMVSGDPALRQARAYQPGTQMPDFLLAGNKPLLIGKDFEKWIISHGLQYDLGADGLPESWLGVPLSSRGRAIGAIVLERYTHDHGFEERDLQFLSTMANRASGTLSNARLMESLRIVNEVGQALTSEVRLSVDGILQLIYKQLGRLMNVRDMYVALYDRGTQMLSFPFAMYRGQRECDWPARKVKGIQGLTEEVLLNKELKFLNPPNVDQWYKDKGIEPKVKPVPKSWVGVPLISGEQVLGIISLQNDEVESLYGDDDVEVLEAIARQAAVALANTRLVERLNVVNKAGQALAGGIDLDPDQILELVYKQASHLMDTRNMYIALYDQNTQELSFPFAMYNGQRERDWRSRKVEGVQGLTEEVLLDPERKPLNPFNVAQWYEAKGIVPKVTPVPKSWVGVPIIMGDHILGVLALQNDEVANLYDDKDIEVLKTLAGQAAVAIENARLYSELAQTNIKLVDSNENLKKRTEQLAALYRMSSELTKSLDLDTVLNTIYDQVKTIEAAPSFFIALCDENLTELDFRLYYDQGLPYSEGCIKRPIRSDKGWADYIARTRETLFFQHVSQEKDRMPVQATVRGKPGDIPESYMGVPLIAGGRVIGVMSAQNYRPNAYDERDFELFLALANQAAVAIEKARLYSELAQTNKELADLNDTLEERVQERTERLTALYRMSSELTKSLDLDTVLNTIYDQVKTIEADPSFFIALCDENLTELDFRLFYDQGAPYREGCIKRPIRSDKGLSDYIVRTREPLFLQHISKEKDCMPVQATVRMSPSNTPENYMGVPLIAGDRVIGVMSAQSYKPNTYDEHDFKLFSALANQAAVAIEKARLYSELAQTNKELVDLNENLEDRVRERTKQLAALQDIGIKVTSELDLEGVLSAVAENANLFMSADFSTLFSYNYEQKKFELAVRRGIIESQPAMPSNEGLAAKIVLTQQSQFISDPRASEDRLIDTPFVQENYIKSYAGVPLIVRGRTVGLLYVNYLQSHTFSDEEKEMIKLLANQAAVASENARLYEHLSQQVRILEKMQGKIADQERSLVVTSMAADFVHKVNNLAGTIPNWVKLAKRSLSYETEKEIRVLSYLDRIANDARVLLKEARWLRDPIPEPKEVDLDELVQDILAQMRYVVPSRIDFPYSSQSNLGHIWAIPAQLSDSIFNVLDNAVKSISEEGTVSVALRTDPERPNDFLELSISDTGCGIAQDKLDKIFDLGVTYWDDTGGTGYGLWRTRNIVENLGGRISVKSKEGQGSTFTIFLPIWSPARPESEVVQ